MYFKISAICHGLFSLRLPSNLKFVLCVSGHDDTHTKMMNQRDEENINNNSDHKKREKSILKKITNNKGL